MNTTIEGNLRETPAKLLEIVQGADALFAGIRERRYDRVLLTGSGTSFHSAAQVGAFMQRTLGIEVSALYPFMITESTFDDSAANGASGQKTLLVGISQGGASFSTYNAMKLAREKGAETASMAGTEKAFIDEQADHVLTVRCGEEKVGAKTKGFYCTKLNLMLMALQMAKAQGRRSEAEYGNFVSGVRAATDCFEAVYGQAERWIEANRARLAAAREIRVVGSQEMYGDTLEGALKLLETMRLPVTGYEFEEFVHGIYNAIDENSTLFILDSGAEERVHKLVEVLSAWTENIYVIGREVPAGDRHLRADIYDDPDLQTFNFLLPIQLICARIPGMKGIDSSKPKDPEFHMKLGSKRFNR